MTVEGSDACWYPGPSFLFSAVARFSWPAVLVLCVLLSCVGCSGAGHHTAFTDAGKFTATPSSCTLLPSPVIEQLTGAAVKGERIDDQAVAQIQECSWATIADVDHPNSTFGQVTVYVDRGTENAVGNAVQAAEKVYQGELDGTKCDPVAGIDVDQSCVFPDNGIRLAAFRVSNLFVRVTCSVRNPNVCSGAQRGATAAMLAKSIVQSL